jgi:hypothetical protein
MRLIEIHIEDVPDSPDQAALVAGKLRRPFDELALARATQEPLYRNLVDPHLARGGLAATAKHSDVVATAAELLGNST